MNDRYTKIVLTVIAGALVSLVLQNAILPTNAQVGLQKVQLCDSPTRCVALGGKTFGDGHTINFMFVSDGIK